MNKRLQKPKCCRVRWEFDFTNIQDPQCDVNLGSIAGRRDWLFFGRQLCHKTGPASLKTQSTCVFNSKPPSPTQIWCECSFISQASWVFPPCFLFLSPFLSASNARLAIVIGQYLMIGDQLAISIKAKQKVGSDATKLDSLMYYLAHALCRFLFFCLFLSSCFDF